MYNFSFTFLKSCAVLWKGFVRHLENVLKPVFVFSCRCNRLTSAKCGNGNGKTSNTRAKIYVKLQKWPRTGPRLTPPSARPALTLPLSLNDLQFSRQRKIYYFFKCEFTPSFQGLRLWCPNLGFYELVQFN